MLLISRRGFVGRVALGILVAPRLGSPQPVNKVARIGILGFSAKTTEMIGAQAPRPSVAAFLRGMRDLGYGYGRDFVTEPLGGEGRPELWPEQARELVRRHVDIIVAAGPNLLSAKRATSSIPVVIAAGSDPVGDGFVQSLARPGGNITGLSLQELDTASKRLELLEEAVPSVASVAVLWTYVSDNSTLFWESVETAAIARGWKLLRVELRSPTDVARAFKTASEAHAGAVLDLASRFTFGRGREISELAIRYRLPVMFDLRDYVDAGGLMAYGPDVNDIWRRAAVCGQDPQGCQSCRSTRGAAHHIRIRHQFGDREDTWLDNPLLGFALG